MLKSIWTWIAASLVLILGIFRSVFARRLRLGKSQSHALVEAIRQRGKSFVIDGEEIADKLPTEQLAFHYIDKVFIYMAIQERFLRAGFRGTDSITFITIFRWQYKRLMILISAGEIADEETIPVYLMQPWDADKIGKLRRDVAKYKPYAPETTYEAVETAVQRTVSGAKDKTGIILHGAPGNGKSFFIRYLAVKYQLPIYIFLLESDSRNIDIVRTFGHVKGPCLVVFEDFDSYFNKRECQIKDAKFTFDGILNVLDGMFYTPKGVVFVMTANDVSKVDDALSQRPSRFEFVKEFGNPDAAIRRQIFRDKEDVEYWVRKTEGMNLDQVLNQKSRTAKASPRELRVLERS